MIELPPYIIYLATFATALVISMVSIPRIIYVSKRKRLFDMPDNNRKVHINIIPNLGGIGIFFAYIIVTSLFIKTSSLDKWNYISASSVLLFLTGLNDDLITITPKQKFVAQFVAAIITVYFADVRINSLHGFFGIYQLPLWASLSFTVLGVMFVTNAFNLIDGIDGLAATIGLLCSLTLGICLALLDNFGGACIAFSLAGAIIGFLRYNISPARIFMGDTGSLLIGFTISILCILFIHSFAPGKPLMEVVHNPRGGMVIALSVLFVPVFDSFRVFITRILKGGSPFRADKTHLHHYLMDIGFGHSRIVTILLTSNILIIIVSLLVQDYDPNIALLSIFCLTFGLYAILYFMRKKRLSRELGLKQSPADTSMNSVKNGAPQLTTGANMYKVADTMGINGNIDTITKTTAAHKD
ncbi:MAG: hypothetical protein BGO69_19515 [Bacteroidetes bacterium 46-16]|nr:MAG: hypothetical protein BGO69_19515 [Bacteroidetes bacterium 46-16]